MMVCRVSISHFNIVAIVFIQNKCKLNTIDICYINASPYQQFYQIFCNKIGFEFTDNLTWKNLKKHFMFPLHLLLMSHCCKSSYMDAITNAAGSNKTDKNTRSSQTIESPLEPNDAITNQLVRAIEQLKSFVKYNRTWSNERNPILVIDEAHNIPSEHFELLYSKLHPLIEKKHLIVVFISSNYEFMSNVIGNSNTVYSRVPSMPSDSITTNHKANNYNNNANKNNNDKSGNTNNNANSNAETFQKTKRKKSRYGNVELMMIDPMSETESRTFLSSIPCKLFVHRMRLINGNKILTNEEITRCIQVSGGIPVWLLQSAIKTPESSVICTQFIDLLMY